MYENLRIFKNNNFLIFCQHNKFGEGEMPNKYNASSAKRSKMALAVAIVSVFIKQSTSWPMSHSDWLTNPHVRHRSESREKKQGLERLKPRRIHIQYYSVSVSHRPGPEVSVARSAVACPVKTTQ